MSSDGFLCTIGTSGEPLIERKAGGDPTRGGDDVTGVIGTNREVIGERGQRVNLRVTFTGNGPFQIQWMREGRVVSTDAAQSPLTYTLRLTGFRRNMAGTYTVTVSNMAGSDTEPIELVYDAPGKWMDLSSQFFCMKFISYFS